MSLAADLFTALSGSAGITAVVGARIYPKVMPEATPLPGPTLVYKDLDSTLTLTHSGPSGLREAHFQFDVYATTEEDADAGADAVNAFLSTFSGTVGGTAFQGAVHIREAGSYERETRLFRALVEWGIWYTG